MKHSFLLAIFFLILASRCASTDPQLFSLKEKAKNSGYPIFLELKNEPGKTTKNLQLSLKAQNLSIHSIQDLSVLLFAFDKQGLILIPETYKTPELICKFHTPIRVGATESCKLETYLYAVEYDKIKLQSISFTWEDGTRHFINREDLEEISEWK
ncbi:hypothetical protein [Leptospira idonii]|uniref:Lipoprotein n=1 Tax=Leptospira idonii TaxID=1193500 RepID=A0A4R9LYW2_9LEPT|nr:hypothetical protein [Leptospira idonii]TGN18557.1 hypothetical protein EHS15_14320 [Leptospira idonii]